MIGFEYNGQINYITRIEDFREFMEPSLYKAIEKAFEMGLEGDSYREKYEQLKAECEALKADYDELESDYDELEDASDELEDCEAQLDDVTEKFKTFKHAIEVLITQYHQRYIEQEEIIPTLEKLIKE